MRNLKRNGTEHYFYSIMIVNSDRPLQNAQPSCKDISEDHYLPAKLMIFKNVL